MASRKRGDEMASRAGRPSYFRVSCEQWVWPARLELRDGVFYADGVEIFRPDGVMPGSEWRQLDRFLHENHPKHGVKTFIPKYPRREH